MECKYEGSHERVDPEIEFRLKLPRYKVIFPFLFLSFLGSSNEVTHAAPPLVAFTLFSFTRYFLFCFPFPSVIFSCYSISFFLLVLLPLRFCLLHYTSLYSLLRVPFIFFPLCSFVWFPSPFQLSSISLLFFIFSLPFNIFSFLFILLFSTYLFAFFIIFSRFFYFLYLYFRFPVQYFLFFLLLFTIFLLTFTIFPFHLISLLLLISSLSFTIFSFRLTFSK